MTTVKFLFAVGLSLAVFMKPVVADEKPEKPCCALNGQDGKDGRDGRDGQSIVGPPGRDGRDGKDGQSCCNCKEGPVFEKGETCRDLKNKGYPSGVYNLNLPSGMHRVYCEMAINGGGYTFLPIASIPRLVDDDMALLFKNNKDVLLRIARTDGSQPYTVISQLQNTGGLSVRLNSYAANGIPQNLAMGKYLYLETHPNLVASTGTTIGFKANNQDVTYTACDNNPKGNYFAFFPNPGEVPASTYHLSNLVYETSGVAVNWRSKAVNPNSVRRMPEDFFLFTEIHYVGCGCYTSTERWLTATLPALGTAIGLR